MPYRGRVRNGTIVLDQDWHLPEGAVVSVELVGQPETEKCHTDPFWGLLADDSKLLDQIVAETMQQRTQRRLRETNAESAS